MPHKTRLGAPKPSITKHELMTTEHELLGWISSRRLAEWLRSGRHDVLETRDLGPDPGNHALLDRPTGQGRIVVTIDTDFGKLLNR